VKEHLKAKGATFFAASATCFLGWKNRLRKKEPLLDPEASGIPAIIRQFLGIPASTNLKKYHNHIHIVLPAFRARCARILKKHTEDQRYAKMRKDFAARIPKLEAQLEKFVLETVKQAIVAPWSKHDETEIKDGIKKLFTEEWKNPNIRVSGWGKILRENSVPVGGAYAGHNLNEEILDTVEACIGSWSDEMTNGAESIAKALFRPVEVILEAVKTDLQACTATPELTDAAIEALEETTENIEVASAELMEKLQNSLNDTHLRFTTETDIECPIAQAMRPSYRRASDPKFALSGNGLYNRQRKVLQGSMLKPERHYI
jgi:hypothetical protein